MGAEHDLQRLLRGMAPVLRGRDWGFACAQALPQGLTPFAMVAEDEGLTLVAPFESLRAAGLQPEGPMARISLTIHSALSAVGLTAAVAGVLAEQGISANVIAGFYHDHIFLPASQADAAMEALRGLAHA